MVYCALSNFLLQHVKNFVMIDKEVIHNVYVRSFDEVLRNAWRFLANGYFIGSEPYC